MGFLGENNNEIYDEQQLACGSNEGDGQNWASEINIANGELVEKKADGGGRRKKFDGKEKRNGHLHLGLNIVYP